MNFKPGKGDEERGTRIGDKELETRNKKPETNGFSPTHGCRRPDRGVSAALHTGVGGRTHGCMERTGFNDAIMGVDFDKLAENMEKGFRVVGGGFFRRLFWKVLAVCGNNGNIT